MDIENKIFSIKNEEKIDIVENNIFIKYFDDYNKNSILNFYRNQIDKIDINIWKQVRWYINMYDFIVHDPIINRAFFKYWEIIQEFNIFKNYNINNVILHCAEAPGGFIQATNLYIKKNVNNIDSDGYQLIPNHLSYPIYTISIQEKNSSFPIYNKKCLKKNVIVTYGKDNTGNINNIDNIYFLQSLIPNKCYLITADGGLDEGNDYNNKEQLHFYLIINEIYLALINQDKNGYFILKIFDTYTDTNIHIIYMLSFLYKSINIYKPKTSRPTNSEKYIICNEFTSNQYIIDIFINILHSISLKLKYNNSLYFTIFKSIPNSFLKQMSDINSFYLQNQCYFLKKSIDLCNNNDFINNYDYILKKSFNQRKRVYNNWIEKYKLII